MLRRVTRMNATHLVTAAPINGVAIVGSAAGILARIALAIAIAIVATSASLRLLGVRRGWGTALLAGAIGWGIGFGLALGLGHWHWNTEGLIVHAVAIAIPTTMAAAVTIDLLARPGSLATGEMAGLLTAPRPVRAVRGRRGGGPGPSSPPGRCGRFAGESP